MVTLIQASGTTITLDVQQPHGVRVCVCGCACVCVCVWVVYGGVHVCGFVWWMWLCVLHIILLALCTHVHVCV